MCFATPDDERPRSVRCVQLEYPSVKRTSTATIVRNEQKRVICNRTALLCSLYATLNHADVFAGGEGSWSWKDLGKSVAVEPQKDGQRKVRITSYR